MRRRAGSIVRLRYVAHYARLSKRHMLGARPLWPLALFERHRLPFAEVVEPDPLARGLMEEVLAAVLSGDEAKPFVRYQPLDRALGSCHRKHSCDTDRRGATRDCADRMALMSAERRRVSAGGATVPGKRANIVYGDRPDSNRTLRGVIRPQPGLCPPRRRSDPGGERSPSLLCRRRLQRQRNLHVVADQEAAGLERGIPDQAELLAV